jgi:hypothetical protein
MGSIIMPLATTIASWPSHTAWSLMAAARAKLFRSSTRPRRGCGVLMPSTPLAYPQVVSRTFASFRVVNFRVSAGQV